MIAFKKRTAVGAYTVIQTKSFTCGISTLRGLFRGSIAVMKANTDGEIVKWPPVCKAYLKRHGTRLHFDDDG